MKRIHKTLVIFLTSFGLLFLSGCASSPIYVANKIEGQIVDAESGEPIEGAIVLALWDLYRVALGRGDYTGNRIKITEVVSDENGRYVVPSWGPRIRPPFHHLSDHDPLLIVLKAGYAPTTLANKFTMDWKNDNRGMFHTSDWNGKTLKLEKAPSDLKILAGLYADAQVTLHYQTGDWRKYPRTTLFIDKQVERLYQMGLKSTILDRMFVTEELSEADKKRLQRYEP